MFQPTPLTLLDSPGSSQVERTISPEHRRTGDSGTTVGRLGRSPVDRRCAARSDALSMIRDRSDQTVADTDSEAHAFRRAVMHRASSFP